jgi:hypothetical protein
MPQDASLIAGWAPGSGCLRFACGSPGTLPGRSSTTIALDMLWHYALMDKVFETAGWSKVVMVAPIWMKSVALIGPGAPRPSHRAKDERRIYARNSYKIGGLDL